MNPRSGDHAPEIDSLFEASRQVEAALRASRAEIARLESEIEVARKKHAGELAQAKQYLSQYAARDKALTQQLGAAKNQLRNYSDHATRLQQANAKLAAELKEQARQKELDLVTARTSFEHMRAKALELEESGAELKPELERLRAELERAQAEVLDREHRYQASVLTYQGYNRQQQDAIAGLKEQLKRTQDELNQYKSRWLEAERLRQEADRVRQETQRAAERVEPLERKLRDLEESHRSLQERLAIEKRRRDQAAGLGPALQEAEARLARTEAELSKATSELALLRASSRLQAPQKAAREPRATTPFAPIDSEILESLALPGYPVRNATRS